MQVCCSMGVLVGFSLKTCRGTLCAEPREGHVGCVQLKPMERAHAAGHLSEQV